MEEWILDDLLECSVCLERLDTSSKVLPCQHTFCKKCLEEISRTHNELRCPECRILVETNIEDLPPNVLLMRILEGIRNAAPDHPSTKQQLHSSFLSDTHHNRNSGTSLPGKPNKHPSLPCAQAIYDYFSNEPGDLSFRKGEIIHLKKKVDLNWYKGDINGRVGVFPVNYVMVLEPLSSQSPECKALYDFKMANDEEEGCLAFNKGEVITVIRRVDENWAEGKLNNRIGIFPIAFVELNAVARTLMKLSVDVQPSASRTAPPTPTTKGESVQTAAATNQQLNSSISVSAPSTTLPTSDSSSNSLTSPSSTSDSTTPTTSSSPSSHTSPSSPPRAISISPNSVPVKRHSLGSTLPNGAKPNNKRHSAEILNNEDILNEVQSATLDMLALQNQHSNSPLERSGSQRLRKPSDGVPPIPGPQAQHSSLQLPALYVALYPYKPGNSDELELKRGGLYTVTERCQDGWFKGHHFRSQKAGVFPGNYVAPAKSLPALQAQVRGLCRSKPTGTPNTSRNGTPPLEPRNPISYLRPQPAPPPHKETSRPNTVAPQAPSPLPPDMTTAVVPPPNVSVPSASTKNPEKGKEKKDKGSLMRRLTSMKKSKSPPPTPYSMDNPVFEDSSLPLSPPVHVRSGSCPNQLISSSSNDNRLFSPTSSHRSKVKERPAIPRISSRMIHHRKSSSMDTPCIDNDLSHTASRPVFLDEKGTFSSSVTPYLHIADTGKANQIKGNPKFSLASEAIFRSAAVKPDESFTHRLAGSCNQIERTPIAEKTDESYTHRLAGSCNQIERTPIAEKTDEPSTYGLAGSGMQIAFSLVSQKPDEHFGLAGSRNNMNSPFKPKLLKENQSSEQGEKQSSGKTPARSSSSELSKSSKWSMAASDHDGKSVPKGLPLPRERFRCIVPYPPNSEYELELQLGDVIYVHKKRDDGWYKGTQQRTGRTGLFPASFVQSF